MENNNISITDKALLIALRNSEQVVMDKLYEAHATYLFNYALRKNIHPDDAEDLIQDLFLDVWTKRESLILTKDFRSYFTWRIRNKIIDKYHHKLVAQAYADEFLATKTDEAINAENKIHYKALEKDLKEGIKQLPEKMQEVFIYRKLECISIKDIAEKLNLSEQTVKNQITLALKKLRVSLADYLAIVFFLLFMK